MINIQESFRHSKRTEVDISSAGLRSVSEYFHPEDDTTLRCFVIFKSAEEHGYSRSAFDVILRELELGISLLECPAF